MGCAVSFLIINKQIVMTTDQQQLIPLISGHDIILLHASLYLWCLCRVFYERRQLCSNISFHNLLSKWLDPSVWLRDKRLPCPGTKHFLLCVINRTQRWLVKSWKKATVLLIWLRSSTLAHISSSAAFWASLYLEITLLPLSAMRVFSWQPILALQSGL